MYFNILAEFGNHKNNGKKYEKHNDKKNGCGVIFFLFIDMTHITVFLC